MKENILEWWKKKCKQKKRLAHILMLIQHEPIKIEIFFRIDWFDYEKKKKRKKNLKKKQRKSFTKAASGDSGKANLANANQTDGSLFCFHNKKNIMFDFDILNW